MKALGVQVARWASVVLGTAALGVLGASSPAQASDAGRAVTTEPTTADGSSAAIAAVFLAAAILVALWRVVIFLIAVALVGVVLLGALVLVTGDAPGDERPAGIGPFGTHSVVLEARGSTW